MGFHSMGFDWGYREWKIGTLGSYGLLVRIYSVRTSGHGMSIKPNYTKKLTQNFLMNYRPNEQKQKLDYVVRIGYKNKRGEKKRGGIVYGRYPW